LVLQVAVLDYQKCRQASLLADNAARRPSILLYYFRQFLYVTFIQLLLFLRKIREPLLLLVRSQITRIDLAYRVPIFLIILQHSRQLASQTLIPLSVFLPAYKAAE